MSSLHLYGNLISQPVRSVLIFLKLSGIDFEFHNLDAVKREYLTEEYAKINPFQTIPAIVHGEYRLWESAAIVAYLADAFSVNHHWYPEDIKIRGRINAYFHWHHQNVRDPISGLIRAKFSPKVFGGPELTPEAEAPLGAKFEECLDNLAWNLSETGYIARTPERSIADIFAYSELAQTVLIDFDLSTHVKVKDWYDQIGDNEVVIDVHKTLRQIAASFNSKPAS